MKKLLNEFGLLSDMQYFEMIAESFTNGQREQAIIQFKVMPRKNKKDMIKASLTHWQSGISQKDICALIDAI